MSRLLVTGASGFIGRHALQPLLQAGHEVFALQHLRPGDAAEGVHWVPGDLLQESSSARTLRQIKPKVLLHLAWYAVPGKFWAANENLAWVEASRRLVRAFAESGGERVVAAGTCAEYDFSAGLCDEATTLLRPVTLYGQTKNEFRGWLEGFAAEGSLSWSWGRIFWLYGPSEHPERLVAYVIRSLLQGKVAQVSSGEQRRDFLHVADVAAAFVTLVQAEAAGAVNVCSGQAIGVRELAQTIAAKLGRHDLLRFGEAAGAEAPLVVGSNERLQSVGWRPQFSLDRGLDQAIGWWQEQLPLSGEKGRGHG